MTKSRQIDLENRIFFRAARLGAEVCSRAGAFYCTEPDDCLQQLIRVYNAFVAEENRLAEGGDAWNGFWRGYAAENAVCHGMDGPVYPPDLPLELAWLKQINNRGKV